MVYLARWFFKASVLYHHCLKGSAVGPHIQYLSTNISTHLLEGELKFKFSDQEKILDIINHSNGDHLSRLNISQAKIKKIVDYKNRKGPFRSLDELLEVDGLGVKILEKLCKQIITEIASDNAKKTNNGNKKTKHFVFPSLPTESTISSIVGIHLAPVGVSWAKLVKSENKLVCWAYFDFINLPKKMLPTDTFKLAVNILQQLPLGSIYVFEGSSSIGLQGQKQPSTVTSYTQQMELSSMLLALINTSTVHNSDINNDIAKLENKVYFLRAKLPARLFRTLVGNECVSSTSTVLQLLDSSNTRNFNLPCSLITVNEKMKNDYLTLPSTFKELLGQALLLTVAFTDLCIIKNPISINAITPGKKNV